MNKLTAAQVKEFRARLPQLITDYRIAKAVKNQYPAWLTAGEKAAASMKEIKRIGDELVRNVVACCDSIEALVNKWADHGYRPTLRGRKGSPEIMIADIYDLIAESKGYSCRAYRGSK